MVGVIEWRYHVTTRVHSPASVGAISSPSSALSRVDLPAFTIPATASRSGSDRRRSRSSTIESAPGSSAYTSRAWRSSARASSRMVPFTAAPPQGEPAG